MNAEQLRELLDYDPNTGVFVWRVSRSRTSAGSVAGSKNTHGYWQIRACGKLYYAHRLAWLYMYGTWPKDQIDHIDGNRVNNRIENLREATNTENQQNRGLSPSNISGFTGVHWANRECKWRAQIRHQRKLHHLGFFDTPEEAHTAYIKAKAEIHTFQPTLRDM
jgi:hypothetical protein